MLEVEERIQLISDLAGLYDFQVGGPVARHSLILNAKLGRFLTGISLYDPPQIFASALINKIEDWGNLPEAPAYDALGALLSYLLKLSDLPPKKTNFLAGLIVKYTLVADPGYLQNLRTEYKIDAVAVRSAAPNQVIPTFTKAITPQPSFEVALNDQPGLEAIINSEDNFLDIDSLIGAYYSSLAVCLIEVPEGTPLGTGFLIAPDLVLTNQHVLQNEEYVKSAVARFDYRNDVAGIVPAPGRVIKIKPTLYYTSPAEELDYAVVQLAERPLVTMMADGELNKLSLRELVLKGKHRGYLVLRSDYIKEHERVNIIQHPNGDPMKAVLTQNYVAANMSPTRVQYVADTMEGSSGSPVFNRKWEVVALHHSGKPYPPESVADALKKAWKGRFRVNEGIPIRAILEDLKNRKFDLEPYLQ